MRDYIQITGRPTITLYDQYGTVKQHLEEDNLIVDAGKNFIIKKAFDRFDDPVPEIDTIAAGDGTTAVAASDTSLENQLGEIIISSYSVTDNQITLFATLSENVATGTINELAEVVREVTESESEITHEELPPQDPQVRRPDITKACEELGWKPTVGLRDGLRRSAMYFTEQMSSPSAPSSL